jgi:general secretion pathway protein G
MVMRLRRGFTLIELMVVLAIIATLLSIAAPRYVGSLERSKEAVLKEDLYQLRDAIAKYYGDKGRYPESIDALAAERYLRRVPVDPITDSSLTWLTFASADAEQRGVFDVRSGAPGRASDGSAYVDW